MDTKTPTYEIYKTLMIEIKIRLTKTENILLLDIPMTGLTSFDAEFSFLQIRKIIELIVFSAVLRDENRYKKLRELQKIENPKDHGDYSKDWQAAVILKQLSEISPHFLPIPIKNISSSQQGSFQVNRSDVAVTHGRLIEIYNQCGGYMHIKNPLGKDFVKQTNLERSKYEAATANAKKSLNFIKSLIWHHAAISLEWSDDLNPRELANPNKAWLVDFGQNNDHNIQMILAEAI